MIYIVDDGFLGIRAFCNELKNRGFDVKCVNNADIAYKLLCCEYSMDFLIVELMVASSSSRSQFPPEETHDCRYAGCVLIESLFEVNPGLAPRKVALWTSARGNTFEAAKRFAERKKIQIFSKNALATPYEFAKRVAALIV